MSKIMSAFEGLDVGSINVYITSCA